MQHVALKGGHVFARLRLLRREPRLARALQQLLRHLVVVHAGKAVPQQHKHLQHA